MRLFEFEENKLTQFGLDLCFTKTGPLQLELMSQTFILFT